QVVRFGARIGELADGDAVAADFRGQPFEGVDAGDQGQLRFLGGDAVRAGLLPAAGGERHQCRGAEGSGPHGGPSSHPSMIRKMKTVVNLSDSSWFSRGLGEAFD